MTKKFTVALNSAKQEQDTLFVNFLKENDMAWWRYVGNFWLVIDYGDRFDSESLRDELLKIYPNVHNFVMDVTGSPSSHWAGFGPNGEKNNMFEWLNETWDAC